MDGPELEQKPPETEPPVVTDATDASDGGSGPSPSVRRAPVFDAPPSWFCVPWYQLMEGVPFSRDCYATRAQCQAARPEPDWGQHGFGCSATDRAWCTEIYTQTGARTRCFEKIKSCEKGRSFAADDGYESSECSEVPAKR